MGHYVTPSLCTQMIHARSFAINIANKQMCDQSETNTLEKITFEERLNQHTFKLNKQSSTQ